MRQRTDVPVLCAYSAYPSSPTSVTQPQVLRDPSAGFVYHFILPTRAVRVSAKGLISEVHLSKSYVRCHARSAHGRRSGRLIAGFIASKLVNSSGEGMLLDIVLGTVGAMVGGCLFNVFGMAGVSGLNVYSVVVAVIGAAAFLIVYHALTSRRA